VPGLEVHEGADEVKPVSGGQGDDKLAESLVCLHQAKETVSRVNTSDSCVSYLGRFSHAATDLGTLSQMV
jgi:hypothetical protein